MNLTNYHLYYTVYGNAVNIDSITVNLPEGKYKLRWFSNHISALLEKHKDDFRINAYGHGVITYKDNKLITKTFFSNGNNN